MKNILLYLFLYVIVCAHVAQMTIQLTGIGTIGADALVIACLVLESAFAIQPWRKTLDELGRVMRSLSLRVSSERPGYLSNLTKNVILLN